MEERRINSAPASIQHEVRILISNGTAEANGINYTSDSETDGASSIQVLEVNSNSIPAPESNTNQNGTSLQLNWPSLHLLHDKQLYFGKCVPLQKAALRGDLTEAKRLLGNNHQSLLRAAITEGYQTAFHVATGAKQTCFVQEMAKLMEADDWLTSQDKNGNTAFCYAAAVGSTEIAEIMLKKNPDLLTIRGGNKMTPVSISALMKHSKMASFLYDQSRGKLDPDDLKKTFFVCVDSGFYDLALKLLNDDQNLALACHEKYGTALHMLARNPSAFTSNAPGRLKKFINLFSGMDITHNRDSSTEALELVKHLWETIIRKKDVDVLKLIKEHSMLLFDAAKLGNCKFLAELIRSYPDLVHQLDEDGRSIFHIAIMHRYANIFNLIYEIGFDKELIATYVDKYDNNLLHLAAQFSDPKPINKAPGPALQMQQELITFKEVEMMVNPSFRQMKNSDGKTPWELFTDGHKTLLEEGEKWMKSRAKSCSLVATIITTMVFQAAFTLPGGTKEGSGNRDGAGKPNLLTMTWFQVFIISDAIAFSCSSISTLIFLSILITSRYTENDFLKRLPFRLMVGLLTLLVSITAMMLAFSSSFFLAYRDGLNCVSMLSIIFVFLPVALYVLLQYRLLGDIFYSTYRSRFLHEPSES